MQKRIFLALMRKRGPAEAGPKLSSPQGDGKSDERKLVRFWTDDDAALRVDCPSVRQVLNACVRAVPVDERAVGLCLSVQVKIACAVAAGTDAHRARTLSAVGTGHGQDGVSVGGKIVHFPSLPFGRGRALTRPASASFHAFGQPSINPRGLFLGHAKRATCVNPGVKRVNVPVQNRTPGLI